MLLNKKQTNANETTFALELGKEKPVRVVTDLNYSSCIKGVVRKSSITKGNKRSVGEQQEFCFENEGPKMISFKRKKASSMFKGVLFVKRQLKWRAQICLRGKKKYIGSYDSELEAALARDQKVRELYGECKKLLNFPEKECVPCFKAQESREELEQEGYFSWEDYVSPKCIQYQNQYENTFFQSQIKLGQSASSETQPNLFLRNDYQTKSTFFRFEEII